MLELANRKKAATVLVALGPQRAAQLLRDFPEEELQALAAEVAEIGQMAPEAVASTLQELSYEIIGRKLAAEGGVAYATDLLERVLGPERAQQLVERIDPAKTRPFRYLAEAEPDVAAGALAPEPPSSIALALAHLDPKVASRILRHLPTEVRAPVAMRIASLQHTHVDVVQEVDADFRDRLMPLLRQQVKAIPGVETLVEMLNAGSRDTEKEVLEAIEDESPELAAKLRDALFTFEDIGRLDDRAIQQVLKSVDTRDLAVALKNADEVLSERILRNLSERARENLLEEIEFLKGLKSSDINEARTRIVRAVRALEEVGTITIERGGDADEVE